ncbi:hypothetical protein H696_03238 [Fonticula alba]|uniref:EGF-like domain-containing protein n=1 Tax=Fonticula alba TaxID=691883 RepID=A0A058Z786_FONAL|nr:hypothetical protein H696_03238 [Fonticula alba]KCV69793.1 hypothetical protein H696_03238 [Fonticula alba]|eukprot:XP_009495399.1 hypothetical protein H696_03238 [Fonticula alba]
MLLQCVTRSAPWPGGLSIHDIMAAVLADHRPDAGALPGAGPFANAGDLVRAAWQADPARRPSATAFRQQCAMYFVAAGGLDACASCDIDHCKACVGQTCLVCVDGFLLQAGACVLDCLGRDTFAGGRCLPRPGERPVHIGTAVHPTALPSRVMARTRMRPGPTGPVISAESLANTDRVMLLPEDDSGFVLLAAIQPDGQIAVDSTPITELAGHGFRSFVELGPFDTSDGTTLIGVGCTDDGGVVSVRYACRLPDPGASASAGESDTCQLGFQAYEWLILPGGGDQCETLAALADGRSVSAEFYGRSRQRWAYWLVVESDEPRLLQDWEYVGAEYHPAVFPLPPGLAAGPDSTWVLAAGPEGTALNPLRMVASRDPRATGASLTFGRRALDQHGAHLRAVFLPTPSRGGHTGEVVLAGIRPGFDEELVFEAQHVPLGMLAHGRTRDIPTYTVELGHLPEPETYGPDVEYTLLAVELAQLPGYPSALVLLTHAHIAVAPLHCPEEEAPVPACYLLRASVMPLSVRSQTFFHPGMVVALAIPPAVPGAVPLASGPPVVADFLLTGLALDDPLQVTLAAVFCPDGTFPPDCLPCDEVCATCRGPGLMDCSRCRLSLPGVSDACVSACPEGTLADLDAGTCECADPGCAECHPTGPGGAYRCTTCAPGFAQDLAAPGGGLVCSACHAACSQCLAPDSAAACTQCSPAGGFLQPGTNTCRSTCPAGFRADVESGRCVACMAGCQACQAADQCTACADGYFLDDAQNRCLACHASCAKCHRAGACAVCQPGLVFLSPNPLADALCGSACAPGEYRAQWRCMDCGPSCALCAGGPDSCQVCAAEYRWLGAPPAAGATAPCTDCPAGCTSCDAAGRCLTCSQGLFLAPDGTCAAGCPAGHFADDLDGSCQACAIQCARCTGDRADQCTDCAAGLTLSPVDGGPAGTCDSACPEGQYFDWPSSGCMPCDPACAACSGPSDHECWSCPAGQTDVLQGGECVLACAAGHVAVARRCLPCHGSCAACTGTRSTECTSCPGGLLALPAGSPAGRCVAGCPVGYHTAPDGCSKCGDHCSSCPGQPAVCALCERGWLLDAPECVAGCPAGASGLGGMCVACDGTCLGCFGPGPSQCSSCPQERAFMLDGACMGACPSGTFPLAGQCLPCHGTCGECFGPGHQECIACPGGQLLTAHGACMDACPSGQYVAQAPGSPPGPTPVCQLCHGSCSECAGPTDAQCTGCPAERFLHAGACLGACPAGTFGCLETASCPGCPAGCAACQPAPAGGPPGAGCTAQCTACLPGFVHSPGRGTCVEACPAGEFLPAGADTCQPCHHSCGACTGDGSACTACAAADAWLDFAQGTCVDACPGPGMGAVDFGPGASPRRVCLPCPAHCEACPVPEPAAAGMAPCWETDGRALACPTVGSCGRCAPVMLLLPASAPGRPADQCVPSCPDGFFPDSVGSRCVPCHATCSRCSGPSADECEGHAPPRSKLPLGT